MCIQCSASLTFETFLVDPLIRLVMESDGVTMAEMVAALETVRHAVARRERASALEASRIC